MSGVAAFKYKQTVDVAPGSGAHGALLEALDEYDKAQQARAVAKAAKAAERKAGEDDDDEEDDEVEGEVVFSLIASGSATGERDRELGSGGVPLPAILASGQDVIAKTCSRGARNPRRAQPNTMRSSDV